jgi:hypothetical protein
MALWENVIVRGTHAARPSPGSPGLLYFESDTGLGYRDSGTGWDQITSLAAPGALTVLEMSTVNVAIPAGNTLVINTGAGLTASLPRAADNTGLSVWLTSKGNSPSYLATIDADTFADGRTTLPGGDNYGAIHVISDGVSWCLVNTQFNATDWT